MHGIFIVIAGVHTVDADFEKGELKVKGVIDPLKIQKRLEKLSKKKVELVSPKVKIKETPVKVETKVKETKEVSVHSITINLHILLKHSENKTKTAKELHLVRLIHIYIYIYIERKWFLCSVII